MSRKSTTEIGFSEHKTVRRVEINFSMAIPISVEWETAAEVVFMAALMMSTGVALVNQIPIVVEVSLQVHTGMRVISHTPDEKTDTFTYIHDHITCTSHHHHHRLRKKASFINNIPGRGIILHIDRLWP